MKRVAREIFGYDLPKTRLGCLERLALRGQRRRERRERMAREGETRLHSQSREGGCLLTTSANATDKKGGGFVGL